MKGKLNKFKKNYPKRNKSKTQSKKKYTRKQVGHRKKPTQKIRKLNNNKIQKNKKKSQYGGSDPIPTFDIQYRDNQDNPDIDLICKLKDLSKYTKLVDISSLFNKLSLRENIIENVNNLNQTQIIWKSETDFTLKIGNQEIKITSDTNLLRIGNITDTLKNYHSFDQYQIRFYIELLNHFLEIDDYLNKICKEQRVKVIIPGIFKTIKYEKQYICDGQKISEKLDKHKDVIEQAGKLFSLIEKAQTDIKLYRQGGSDFPWGL